MEMYDYELPSELIAQTPAKRRVQARLMVLPLDGAEIQLGKVAWLPNFLKAGDLLVLNQTRVVPARLKARKPTGGAVEVLLLDPVHPRRVFEDGAQELEVLLKSHRPMKPGEVLLLGQKAEYRLEVLERGPKGRAWLKSPVSGLFLAELFGQTPLPPYIKRPQGPDQSDLERYQTVYAQEPGAVAAPTAGLHLSPELFAALARRGVNTARLTLHVGYGTFAEPSADDLARGKLHAEWVEVPDETARAINDTRAKGGRVIAVGTTSVRSLEWAAADNGIVQAKKGWCDILIAEGHSFKAIDGLMTNFHLPRTTLLMLVAAIAGRERILDAYRLAVREGFRFYSFGDAMLLV